MNELAAGFKALADPTRLRLLNLLRHGELCVCDLMEALDVPQPKVSRHLSFLKKERWVSGRRSGKWMHYKLSTPRQAILVKVMDALLAHLGDLETARWDEARLRRHLAARPSGRCD